MKWMKRTDPLEEDSAGISEVTWKGKVVAQTLEKRKSMCFGWRGSSGIPMGLMWRMDSTSFRAVELLSRVL